VAQWYVSAVFARPPSFIGSNEFWLVFPTPPLTRGGLVSPAAPHLWYVSLSGREADEPPTTAEEMLAYAETLEAPWIAELLGSAGAIGAPHLFRRLTARWRRYDLLPEPLPGFIPLGDSIATLNPLLGQGISVAAAQAAALASLLGESPRDGLERRYLTQAAACRDAWLLGGLLEPASGEDAPHFDWATYRAIGTLLENDRAFHRLYVGVWHLIEPAAALDAPISLVQPEGP
jgi:hypothetical protein